MDNFSHDQIAELVAKRIKRMGYPISFANLTSATHGEQPDVLGIDPYGISILIEVKMSKSDFLADKKKPWRANPSHGIGDYRVYVAPKGVLKMDDMPYGWQFWEISGTEKNLRLTIIKGYKRIKEYNDYNRFPQMSWKIVNMDMKEYVYFAKGYYQSISSWLIKIMQRAQDDGHDFTKYANNYRVK